MADGFERIKVGVKNSYSWVVSGCKQSDLFLSGFPIEEAKAAQDRG